MWIVWENINNQHWYFDDEDDARKHYEKVKDLLYVEEMRGLEEVWLFKADMKAAIVEDESRSRESAREHGFDFWCKWEDVKF